MISSWAHVTVAPKIGTDTSLAAGQRFGVRFVTMKENWQPTEAPFVSTGGGETYPMTGVLVEARAPRVLLIWSTWVLAGLLIVVLIASFFANRFIRARRESLLIAEHRGKEAQLRKESEDSVAKVKADMEDFKARVVMQQDISRLKEREVVDNLRSTAKKVKPKGKGEGRAY